MCSGWSATVINDIIIATTTDCRPNCTNFNPPTPPHPPPPSPPPPRNSNRPCLINTGDYLQPRQSSLAWQWSEPDTRYSYRALIQAPWAPVLQLTMVMSRHQKPLLHHSLSQLLIVTTMFGETMTHERQTSDKYIVNGSLFVYLHIWIFTYFTLHFRHLHPLRPRSDTQFHDII